MMFRVSDLCGSTEVVRYESADEVSEGVRLSSPSLGNTAIAVRGQSRLSSESPSVQSAKNNLMTVASSMSSDQIKEMADELRRRSDESLSRARRLDIARRTMKGASIGSLIGAGASILSGASDFVSDLAKAKESASDFKKMTFEGKLKAMMEAADDKTKAEAGAKIIQAIKDANVDEEFKKKVIQEISKGRDLYEVVKEATSTADDAYKDKIWSSIKKSLVDAGKGYVAKVGVGAGLGAGLTGSLAVSQSFYPPSQRHAETVERIRRGAYPVTNSRGRKGRRYSGDYGVGQFIDDIGILGKEAKEKLISGLGGVADDIGVVGGAAKEKVAEELGKVGDDLKVIGKEMKRKIVESPVGQLGRDVGTLAGGVKEKIEGELDKVKEDLKVLGPRETLKALADWARENPVPAALSLGGTAAIGTHGLHSLYRSLLGRRRHDGGESYSRGRGGRRYASGRKGRRYSGDYGVGQFIDDIGILSSEAKERLVGGLSGLADDLSVVGKGVKEKIAESQIGQLGRDIGTIAGGVKEKVADELGKVGDDLSVIGGRIKEDLATKGYRLYDDLRVLGPRGTLGALIDWSKENPLNAGLALANLANLAALGFYGIRPLYRSLLGRRRHDGGESYSRGRGGRRYASGKVSDADLAAASILERNRKVEDGDFWADIGGGTIGGALGGGLGLKIGHSLAENAGVDPLWALAPAGVGAVLGRFAGGGLASRLHRNLASGASKHAENAILFRHYADMLDKEAKKRKALEMSKSYSGGSRRSIRYDLGETLASTKEAAAKVLGSTPEQLERVYEIEKDVADKVARGVLGEDYARKVLKLGLMGAVAGGGIGLLELYRRLTGGSVQFSSGGRSRRYSIDKVATGVGDAATSGVGDAVASGNIVASGAGDTAASSGAKMAKSLWNSASNWVKENPMKTAAMVGGAGVIGGMGIAKATQKGRFGGFSGYSGGGGRKYSIGRAIVGVARRAKGPLLSVAKDSAQGAAMHAASNAAMNVVQGREVTEGLKDAALSGAVFSGVHSAGSRLAGGHQSAPAHPVVHGTVSHARRGSKKYAVGPQFSLSGSGAGLGVSFGTPANQGATPSRMAKNLVSVSGGGQPGPVSQVQPTQLAGQSHGYVPVKSKQFVSSEQKSSSVSGKKQNKNDNVAGNQIASQPAGVAQPNAAAQGNSSNQIQQSNSGQSNDSNIPFVQPVNKQQVAGPEIAEPSLGRRIVDNTLRFGTGALIAKTAYDSLLGDDEEDEEGDNKSSWRLRNIAPILVGGGIGLAVGRRGSRTPVAAQPAAPVKSSRGGGSRHYESKPVGRFASIGESVGSLAGGVTGALAGGLVGTPGGPAAVATGAVGGIGGGYIGGKIGKAVGGLFDSKPKVVQSSRGGGSRSYMSHGGDSQDVVCVSRDGSVARLLSGTTYSPDGSRHDYVEKVVQMMAGSSFGHPLAYATADSSGGSSSQKKSTSKRASTRSSRKNTSGGSSSQQQPASGSSGQPASGAVVDPNAHPQSGQPASVASAPPGQPPTVPPVSSAPAPEPNDPSSGSSGQSGASSQQSGQSSGPGQQQRRRSARRSTSGADGFKKLVASAKKHISSRPEILALVDKAANGMMLFDDLVYPRFTGSPKEVALKQKAWQQAFREMVLSQHVNTLRFATGSLGQGLPVASDQRVASNLLVALSNPDVWKAYPQGAQRVLDELGSSWRPDWKLPSGVASVVRSSNLHDKANWLSGLISSGGVAQSPGAGGFSGAGVSGPPAVGQGDSFDKWADRLDRGFNWLGGMVKRPLAMGGIGATTGALAGYLTAPETGYDDYDEEERKNRALKWGLIGGTLGTGASWAAKRLSSDKALSQPSGGQSQAPSQPTTSSASAGPRRYVSGPVSGRAQAGPSVPDFPWSRHPSSFPGQRLSPQDTYFEDIYESSGLGKFATSGYLNRSHEMLDKTKLLESPVVVNGPINIDGRVYSPGDYISPYDLPKLKPSDYENLRFTKTFTDKILFPFKSYKLKQRIISDVANPHKMADVMTPRRLGVKVNIDPLGDAADFVALAPDKVKKQMSQKIEDLYAQRIMDILERQDPSSLGVLYRKLKLDVSPPNVEDIAPRGGITIEGVYYPEGARIPLDVMRRVPDPIRDRIRGKTWMRRALSSMLGSDVSQVNNLIEGIIGKSDDSGDSPRTEKEEARRSWRKLLRNYIARQFSED